MRRLRADFYPWARGLLDVADQHRISYTITSTRRSLSQQRRLYNLYLAGRHPLPVAPPGCSQHNYGLAMDVVIPNEADRRWLGFVWKHWGGYWGGDRDPVHFGVGDFPCPR